MEVACYISAGIRASRTSGLHEVCKRHQLQQLHVASGSQNSSHTGYICIKVNVAILMMILVCNGNRLIVLMMLLRFGHELHVLHCRIRPQYIRIDMHDATTFMLKALAHVS
jgi:hypothetical protein